MSTTQNGQFPDGPTDGLLTKRGLAPKFQTSTPTLHPCTPTNHCRRESDVTDSTTDKLPAKAAQRYTSKAGVVTPIQALATRSFASAVAMDSRSATGLSNRLKFIQTQKPGDCTDSRSPIETQRSQSCGNWRGCNSRNPGRRHHFDRRSGSATTAKI